MAIGGKEFQIEDISDYPSLKIDVIISSPSSSKNERHKEKVLIDTGSDFTLIPNKIIRRLRLARTGTIKEIESFDGDTKEIQFYSAKITITGVMEEICEVGGINYDDSLIGMDLIKKWHLLINSPKGTFEIANEANYKPLSIL